ncbi:MAG: prephenate dehydrogenase/arogenate dehydrogenase family protein [Thermoleophilia bacterium]
MVPTSETQPLRIMAVIGVGLMGGSLALAARQRARVQEVRGFDADPRALDEALAAGVITRRCGSAGEAAAGADLVVVCTPVRSIPALVEESAAADPQPRLITDIGSTKGALVSQLSNRARPLFIGGHPICGAETSGVRFARADLFERATYFLCPPEDTPPELHEVLHSLVAALGARPVVIGAEAHDRIMALVSHVPHVLANVLMAEVGGFEASGRRALYSVGPSFKDLTRVAGANPAMWSDIFFDNKEALIASLKSIAADIMLLCEHLRDGNEDRVLRGINRAATHRRELLQYEDIVPETLYRITVRIPDEPGVLSRVMTALGNANINIEDLTLHHFSRTVGGDLVLYVSGEQEAASAHDLLEGLGYPAVVAFTGDHGA